MRAYLRMYKDIGTMTEVGNSLIFPVIIYI